MAKIGRKTWNCPCCSMECKSGLELATSSVAVYADKQEGSLGKCGEDEKHREPACPQSCSQASQASQTTSGDGRPFPTHVEIGSAFSLCAWGRTPMAMAMAMSEMLMFVLVFTVDV